MPHALDPQGRLASASIRPSFPSTHAVAIALSLAFVAAALLAGQVQPGSVPSSLPRVPSAVAPAPQGVGPANAWTNLSPPSAPSPRLAAPVAYDSKTGNVFLFGGWGAGYGVVLNDTWTYSPATNAWTNLSPPAHPDLYVTPSSAAMVYDAQADRIILFGGCLKQGSCWPNQTWAYDPNANTWSQMTPVAVPDAGQGFGMVYDSLADRVLVFGIGSFYPDCQCATNTTWVYDYQADNWTQRVPSVGPSGRFNAAMAYDSRVSRTLLFGGCVSGMSCTAANDTWSYDYGLDAWTNMSPVASPPKRYEQLPMVYDSGTDHFILFGEGASPPQNQTWSYNFTTNRWVSQHPVRSPPGRYASSMVYDPGGGQTILFGGAWATCLNDTWSYTYGPPAPSPPSAPRNLGAFMSLTYAGEYVNLLWQMPADDGGYSVTQYRVYRGPTSGSESFLASTASTSYADWFGTPGTVYFYVVTAVNAMGEGPRSNEVNSTPTVPGTPSNLRAAAGTTASTWNQVNLTWYAPGDGGSELTGYLVYRGTASGTESFLSSAGLNWWFLDTSLAANTTYYYEVAAVNGVGIGARSSEVNVTAKPPPPPPDYEPPTVVITFPTWGAILNTTVITVQGTASDNMAVSRVEVSVNNGSWVVASGTKSWSLTVTLKQGANTILVSAYDPSGNGGGTIVNVTVRTQPATQGGGGGGGGNGTASLLEVPIAVWYAALVAAAGIVTVVVALLWSDRRRRRTIPPP